MINIKFIKAVALSIAMIMLAAICPVYSADYRWLAASPDGRITVNTWQEDGGLYFDVLLNNNQVVRPSTLGITTDKADFSQWLTFAETSRRTINETYPMIGGNKSVYTNNCSELTLSFTKDGYGLNVIFRVFNDGVAFRYETSGSELVTDESTLFSLENNTVFAMDYEASYEAFYKERNLNELEIDSDIGMPFLTKSGQDNYVLIAEADLSGTYCGSVLKPKGDGQLAVDWEPKQTEPVRIYSEGFSTPWRAMVIGDSKTIADTQMIENLCPPSKIEDTSWIKPGVSSWTWFNGDPTNDPEVYKKYIDFSAEMGFEYVLLDEGWQPRIEDHNGRKSYSGEYPWVFEVLDYAASKNIGVLVWSTYWDLDTPEERERMADWARMGIKGIKVDFFESETQNVLIICDEITKKSADLKLLVNYHGCNKPTGERRTWPHLLTREGIYGFEHFISGGDWGPTAKHNCTVPFTRDAVGPSDYTPAITSYYGKNYFSAGHKAALHIVFESGLQCFSDKPEVYRESPLYNLLKDFPDTWDDSKLLAGDPGQYVVMLRQSGDTYYLGAITDSQRTTAMSLDFLPITGTYLAEIYSDGVSDTEIASYSRIVTERNNLVINQLSHGGFAVKFTKINSDAIIESSKALLDIQGHWAEQNIRRLYDEGLLNPYFYGRFAPDAQITRAEFVAMLLSSHYVELERGEFELTDVQNHWAYTYILTAFEVGIIKGTSDTTFSPDESITREQLVSILGRYRQGLTNASTKKAAFTDSADISDYATDYVAAFSELGIVSGYPDGTFMPKNNITRAESAVIIERFLDYL